MMNTAGNACPSRTPTVTEIASMADGSIEKKIEDLKEGRAAIQTGT